MTASPASMCELAGAVGDLAWDLRDGLSSAREKTLIPGDAFGNSDGVASFEEGYMEAFQDAGQAVEDLAAVMDADADTLYGVAFSYQETDRQNAQNIPCVPGEPC